MRPNQMSSGKALWFWSNFQSKEMCKNGECRIIKFEFEDFSLILSLRVQSQNNQANEEHALP